MPSVESQAILENGIRPAKSRVERVWACRVFGA